MVDLEHMRKIQNCLPFADEKAGIVETQQAIGEMIAELSQLRSELERVKDDNTELRKRLQFCTDLVVQAESKLTASESARRVLVEEIKAGRSVDTSPHDMRCRIMNPTRCVTECGNFMAMARLEEARAAVDRLKLLEGSNDTAE